MANPPPPYSETDTIPTLYDDTHRGLWGFDYSVGTIGNSANLIGYLEHHDPQTDGSFGICVAGGNGVCVSKVCVVTFLDRGYLTDDGTHVDTVRIYPRAASSASRPISLSALRIHFVRDASDSHWQYHRAYHSHE